MIDTSGDTVKPMSTKLPAAPLTPIQSTETVLDAVQADLDDIEVLGGPGDSAEKLQECFGQLLADIEGQSVVVEQLEEERRLLDRMPAVAVVAMSQDGIETEAETESALAKVVGTPLKFEATERGAGAKKACTTQREQTHSSWLADVEATLDPVLDPELFASALISIKFKTAAIAKAKAGQKVRSLDEQATAFAAQAESKHRIVLEHEGRSIDPASLLRLRRQKAFNSFSTFAKKSRQVRWISGSTSVSKASVVVAGDGATIQAGEIWLVLSGPSEITPCVVYGAFHRFKNGLRPETNPASPLLLKDTETIQLQLYHTTVSETPSGTTFRAAPPAFDLLREPRRMLLKLSSSRGPFDMVDVSSCRSQRLLVLHAAAVKQLQSLQADVQILQLWNQLGTGSSPLNDLLEPAVQALAAVAAKAAGKPTRPATPVAGTAAAPAQARFNPRDIIGKSVKKKFGSHGWFIGTITDYDEQTKWYSIKFSDGDTDDVRDHYAKESSHPPFHALSLPSPLPPCLSTRRPPK